VAKKEKLPLDRLIIFTRYPEPGATKTRLIPALGPQGAADLHRQMSEHTLTWARRLKETSAVSPEVRYDGGDEHRIQQWLGADIPFFHQGSGDLGARMARAFQEAFQAGAGPVILVGTDCPGLTGQLIQKSFAVLQQSDVVLGPADDGGYYLIGLRRVIPQLFAEIPWGTGGVLSKTLQIAEDLKLRVFLLEPLGDVDRPEDLPIWEKFGSAPSHPSPLRDCVPIGRGGMKEETSAGYGGIQRTPPNIPLARPPAFTITKQSLKGEGKDGEDLGLISIIIPTLNEEENISACLASTQNASHVERIVVDGGSSDRTVEVARTRGVKVLTSPAGRARQMNAGAEVADGDLLLFLHADTRLPAGFAHGVRQTLARPGVVAGAFQFRLDASGRKLQIIEKVANWRSRVWQMPYGDQAIFIRSALFREIGGYPDMPIMEDFEFIRRLKRKGRILTLPQAAITSARRWRRYGLWKTTLLNELVVCAYYLGIPASRIHRFARRSG
jgi:rSAM/selenodomain-associated transferase 2/rSAM/selenodomain-associated transferase 1